MTFNPFPGDRPYGEADKARLFGRGDLSQSLVVSLVGSPCLTVFGPPGAGKTSLFQASVLPALASSYDARIVHVRSWQTSDDPSQVVAEAILRDLRMSDGVGDLRGCKSVQHNARRAARASSRLLVLCLDQIEELVFPDRSIETTERFFECLTELLDLALRPVRIVLCIREDYLGQFLSCLRGRLRMLEHYFRVGAFSVETLCEIALRTAAEGDPPQEWSAEELLPHFIEMRAHDQPARPSAEIRMEYAQSFCRALFERRAAGVGSGLSIGKELQPFIERTVMELDLDSLEGEGEP